MIASIPSATLLGVEGRPVHVEVHVSNGLPGFTVVGLPDAACRESRDRVRAALISHGLPWPTKRVTVNLAPSGVRKGGPGLDLPIAVGLLIAAGEVPAAGAEGMAFLGELGLDGSLRPVPGVVPMVAAMATGTVVVPPASVPEASVLGRHRVRAAPTLGDVVACLRGDQPWPDAAVLVGAVDPAAPSVGAAAANGPEAEPADRAVVGRAVAGATGAAGAAVADAATAIADPGTAADPAATGVPDLADVRGQPVARVALEVAAAGGHHLLLCGPPGAGKTMLARRLPALLPALEGAEALEATTIHSAAGVPLPPDGLLRRPPFRAPHHGASAVALVGGGSAWMRPGEISLAHGGVLFLDELGEFPASVLDSLRQPLEEGVVRVCRARGSVSLPARFLLVAATNPCPCGGSGTGMPCRCSPAALARYRRRLSGPLLDRFDLRVVVSRPDPSTLVGGPPGEATAPVARRVAQARARARARGFRSNAEIPAPLLDRLAPLAPPAWALLEQGLRRGTLSARGLHRVRRVARTIADLAGHGEVVSEEHVCLALALRGEAGLGEVAA